MSHRRLSRPLGLALSGLLATAALALVPATAQARVAAPSGLAPTGTTSSSTPTFTWNRVSGATQYDLVISAGGNAIAQVTTANNRWVPTESNLPDGDITWQVRADTPTGNSAWASADATISSTAAPSPVAPVGGVLLTQPDNPPLFSWSPVAGAIGYELQVDNSGSWTSPTTYTPSGTSYFVDFPQSPGTWYWRVRANRGNGLFTAWSSTATYDVGQLDDPQAGADMTPSPVMQDVSLDWQPVPGAKYYELEVGKDPDFNTIIDHPVTVYGTRYQPARTYQNGGYYWRVRAVDAANTPMPWTSAAPFTFQRNWPQKPTLEYPANQFAPTVGNPMFYQWTPVRHASHYQLDVGSDPNFSPGTYVTCTTTSTTFAVNGSCGALGQGQTTYWRVKALDYYVNSNTPVEGIYSDIHHFVYSAGQINQTSPVNGDTVDVPTLTWDPIAGTQTYHVVISDKDNNVAASVDTSSTSWTPETALDPAKNPYTWTVQSTPNAGNISPLYPGISFNVSGNAPTGGTSLAPITGVAGDPATEDFPDLTWGPRDGASYYRVRIGVLGSGFYDANASHINVTTYPYPAATDTGTHYLSPGDYFWYVDAYDASNHLLGTTSPADVGQFTIKDLPAASGQKVALDGLASVSGSAGCSNKLSNSNALCTGVPATPFLSWDAQSHAAGYAVYLANDRELTNRVVNPYALTTNTVWSPTSDLPDNTAQGSYYWFVRPCKSMSPLQCNPDPISTNAAATNAFRKLSPAVQPTAPANGASLSGDPTFSWTDYYDTNQGVSYAGGGDASYQTALAYHVQIATSSTFNPNSGWFHEITVDQPFYTPSALTLPQGTLYWRVQAVDPAGNNVNWSAVRSFSNDQPTISLAPSGAVPSPVGGVTVAGSTPFRWAPMNGASSYTIEVYKNDDSTHSPANQVIVASTHQSAYVPQNYLPPSTSAYRWRVRWYDADGQPRPYSADGRFFVTASSVTLTAPATGTLQKNNALYFTWNAVPFAARYTLDVRDANNNSVWKPTTPATANAPSMINDGVYTWRVTALDPSGGAIATSAWRTFTVDATAPIVVKVTPSPYGKPKSKLTAAFSERVAGVTGKTFQLHPYGKKTKLAAKVTLSSNGRVATLVPKANLKKGKSYTGTVTRTIHDVAGNHLVTYSWSFSV